MNTEILKPCYSPSTVHINRNNVKKDLLSIKIEESDKLKYYIITRPLNRSDSIL